MPVSGVHHSKRTTPAPLAWMRGRTKVLPFNGPALKRAVKILLKTDKVRRRLFYCIDIILFEMSIYDFVFQTSIILEVRKCLLFRCSKESSFVYFSSIIFNTISLIFMPNMPNLKRPSVSMMVKFFPANYQENNFVLCRHGLNCTATN